MSGPAVDHESVERRLASADLDVSGAEVHGVLCGLLCSASPDAEQVWLAELFKEAAEGDLLVEECRRLLHRLYRDTRQAVESAGFAFSPLLPDDEQPIGVRAAAVVQWCQGFLYGIGLSGAPEGGAVSQQTREALRDIGEFTRMDLEGLGDGNEEEEALMQVTEFLRVAAMLVHQEMGKRTGSGDDYQ